MTKEGGRQARQPEVTRRRIVEAAGRLFAKRGFNGVGFRDIATAARVSLRMPNHHFGTKEQLFAECVRYALTEKMDFPALFASEPSGTATSIAAKIRACLFAVIPPDGRSSWYGEILGRALTENLNDALKAFQDGLRPAREWFHLALRTIRPRMTPTAFALWYGSLWAQVSFFVTARAAILARLGKRRYDKALLRMAANHLVHGMLKQLEN